MIKCPVILHQFKLSTENVKTIHETKYSFGFDGFGEVVYYRTYSRTKTNGTKERWPDTIVRVVNGNLSIRKDWYIKHGIRWDEKKWQKIGGNMAVAMIKMKFLPPGRGLWISGTDFMYKKGAAGLCNCGYATLKDPVLGLTWTMDMLMCGVGVGGDTEYKGPIKQPAGTFTYQVPDSREGWVKSLEFILKAYIPDSDGKTGPLPTFDYTLIRPSGTPIKGFGGTASGPAPLQKLHRRVNSYFKCFISSQTNNVYESIITMVKELGENHQDEKKLSVCDRIKLQENFVKILLTRDLSKATWDDWKTRTDYDAIIIEIGEALDYPTFKRKITKLRSETWVHLIKFSNKTYDHTRLFTDILNAIGCCVVAGNIRRSSELIGGSPRDLTFLNMKNYTINPERGSIGWMSNNTVRLETSEDFLLIPSIAHRIRDNGEPGIMNCINVKKYGRILRTPIGREKEPDKAKLLNPCGEIPLEPFELCNLSEVFPPRCSSDKEFSNAIRHATLYSSNVSLLSTHWTMTNAVIARNRRIGVSLSGISEMYEKNPAKLTRLLRDNYAIVRAYNKYLADEAGIPESIRVTTNKPSGTISQLVGTTSGIHFPTYSPAIRRMRIAEDSPLIKILAKAGYPYEKDLCSDRTLVFEFPIIFPGKTRSADKLCIWEQMLLGATFQREWSDNSISQTVYFTQEEGKKQLEIALAQLLPLIKTISALPQMPKTSYKQAPYEQITIKEYERRRGDIKKINWTTYSEADGECPKYCNSDKCMLQK